MFDRDGKTILDQIVFAPQAADISLGRMIDGKDPWVTYDAPSPQMLNAPQRCGTRRYSARPARAHVIDLSLLETPKVGTTVTWKVAGGDVGRGTTATVSDLNNGTTYLLRVRAVSGLGSSRATTVQAGPAPCPGHPPMSWWLVARDS